MSTIYRSEFGGEQLITLYREMLDDWPIPAERRQVATCEGQTFVMISGPEDAPPVLLLHGSGTNAAMWIDEVVTLAQDFRVYAIDMIGEPGLSAPSRPPLDSDAYACWLDDVLGGLGIEKASIVGASLGGWLALDYAVRRSDRVHRLGLLCPGGIGKQTMGWLPKAMVLRLFGAWGRRRTMTLVAGVDPNASGAFLDYLSLNFKEFKPRFTLPVFSDQDLEALAMPILVIVGERDVMFDSAETARRMRAAATSVEVRILPGIGHSVFGQGEALRDFLT